MRGALLLALGAVPDGCDCSGLPPSLIDESAMGSIPVGLVLLYF